MFLFCSALYCVNDDYRYPEPLKNIIGDNHSARPIQFFVYILKYLLDNKYINCKLFIINIYININIYIHIEKIY